MNEAKEMTDSRVFLDLVRSFDRQLEAGLEIGAPLARMSFENVENVVLCGMGGSAIGGDILKSLALPRLELPFSIRRSYDLPAFASSRTLAIVSSYSGQTEEALSAFEAGLAQGCKLLCLASGGELADRAGREKQPLIELPRGLPPRMSLGYSLGALASALPRLRGFPDLRDEFRHSLPFVRQACDDLASTGENEASRLAARLQGALAVFYGSRGSTEAVARRWCGQVAENAKQLSFFGSFPEMNHNEIAGWKHPERLEGEALGVFLFDRDDHPRIQLRMQVTLETLAKAGYQVAAIHNPGANRTERLLRGIVLADCSSIHLAQRNREDPERIDAILDFKNRLSTSEGE